MILQAYKGDISPTRKASMILSWKLLRLPLNIDSTLSALSYDIQNLLFYHVVTVVMEHFYQLIPDPSRKKGHASKVIEHMHRFRNIMPNFKLSLCYLLPLGP